MPAGGKAVLFPAKLDAILRSQSSQDIVGWQTPSEREENGEEIALTVDSFMVRDRSKFQSEVMPKHFESRKIESFQRSLNMWGFRKLKKSSYVWVHPTFSRTMTNTEVMGVLRKGTANRGALEVSKLKEIASFVQSSSSSGGSGGAAAQGPRWDVSADWTALETRVKHEKKLKRIPPGAQVQPIERAVLQMREQVRRLSQVVSTCFAVQQTNAKAERRTASALTAVEREVALLRRAHLGNGGGGRPLIASSGAPAFASSAKRGQSGSAGGNSQAKRSRRAGGSGSGGGRSARAVSVAVPLAASTSARRMSSAVRVAPAASSSSASSAAAAMSSIGGLDLGSLAQPPSSLLRLYSNTSIRSLSPSGARRGGGGEGEEEVDSDGENLLLRMFGTLVDDADFGSDEDPFLDDDYM